MIVRPWNLAAYSAGALIYNNFETEGTMTPGFCPRNPSMTRSQYLAVEDKIKDFFNKDYSIVNIYILYLIINLRHPI